MKAGANLALTRRFSNSNRIELKYTLDIKSLLYRRYSFKYVLGKTLIRNQHPEVGNVYNSKCLLYKRDSMPKVYLNQAH